MFIQILQHVPVWVFGVFVALLYVGIKQAKPREVSIGRLILIPVLMMAWSLSGVLGSFGHQQTLAVLAWATGVALAIAGGGIAGTPDKVRYDATRRVLQLPGSWVPLALMMGIFWLKFGVGVSLALQPALADGRGFAGVLSLAYGVLSGVFAARALRLLRVTRREVVLAAA